MRWKYWPDPSFEVDVTNTVPLGPSARSIAGVAVMPISGTIWPQLSGSPVVSPAASIDLCHSTVPASASNAYTLSCSVAAITTLCRLPPGKPTALAYSGCASTRPSTGHIAFRPKLAALTVAGVRVASARYRPVLAASLCQVSTSADTGPGGVGLGAGGAGPEDPLPLQATKPHATRANSDRRTIRCPGGPNCIPSRSQWPPQHATPPRSPGPRARISGTRNRRHTLGRSAKRRTQKMAVLIAGLIVFLGAHSMRLAADPWRTRQVAALGPIRWKIL